MPLKKLLLRPGVNRENTRYTNEGGWYDCDKIRFRQGTPEKIGGWEQISDNRFLGVCRSLWNWVTLGSVDLIGVGTNLKYYIERGAAYNDITPLRVTTAAGDVTFAATTGSSVVTVTDTAHGAVEGDYVTFSGALTLGGDITAATLNTEFQIVTVPDDDTYTIQTAVAATASDTGNGGANVVGAYQINVGPEIQESATGWSAGPWGFGAWGEGQATLEGIRIWNHSNFGEDLVFGPRGGALYYWDASAGFPQRGVLVSSLSGASDVPAAHTTLLVSDISRFVLCFGASPLGETALDPMLIRWSDQEDVANWTPSITNQAGDLRLSTGSKIVTATQTRQEILVWTDAALYSLQYQGPPFVWGAQTLGDNISIIGPNVKASASNVTYWMGKDKFYRYDGRVQTMRCDLRQYIFQNINLLQADQIFASTVEAFNEVWWFYPSADSTTPNRYVVYNYAEDIWYYGNMTRTAWIDSQIRNTPVAAYSGRLLDHETGYDDGSNNTPVPIESYITSSEFDIDDGNNFSFIWRVLPDVTFRGSTSTNPSMNMTLLPLQNSGSGYTNPASEGGTNTRPVTRSTTIPIEQFTGQINTRVRGRQMAIKVESSELGVAWQLGAPRIDVRPDGRR